MQQMQQCLRPCGAPRPATSTQLISQVPYKSCRRLARCRTAHTVGAGPTEPVQAPAGVEPSVTVDRVLSLIAGTDGGLAMPEARRVEVDGLLDQLEAVGRTQQPRPLLNPLIWGNYEVAYTSTRRQDASERGSQPSGGRFRGRLGRSLFRTAGLFQSVLQPNIVTNKVAFRLFGLISGYVGLRGTLRPVGSGDDTVAVEFEPPVLVLGSLRVTIGGRSRVQLATTYLDERVRVGKGGAGSMFVFTRGGAAEHAGMDQVGLERTSSATAGLLAAACVAMLLGGLGLWVTFPHPVARGAAMLVLSLGAAMGAVLRNGGIVPSRNAPGQATAKPAPGSA